ncbi:MAG: DUF3726 domain-containing protein, partial [Woeseiaceae bacterium]
MKVSRNELLQLCQKVFQGLDFPAGVEKDAAYMVSWLDTHRLPGARLLYSELAYLSKCPPQAAEVVTTSAARIVLDAKGQSALVVAPGAIDMAYAAAHAAVNGRVMTALTKCRCPLYAIALPLSRAATAYCFHLRWQVCGRAYDFVVDEKEQPFLYGELDTLADARETTAQNDSCDLFVECVRDGASELLGELNARRGSPTLDPHAFASREKESVRHGVEVADEIWNEMVTLSRRILVAATEESRIRGAGATMARWGPNPEAPQTWPSKEGAMLVKDVMTPKLEWVDPDLSVREVARKMRDQEIGCIPVVGSDALIGMITDRDITCRAVAVGRDPATTKARDIMSEDMTWCFDDQDVTEAAHIME